VAEQEIIKRARTEKRTQLTEIEAKQLLKDAGINVVETKLATSNEEAISVSESLGFPVAMKISSVDVLHKSDAGGVKLGIKTKEQVAEAYDEIMESVKKAFPDAKVEGVTIQKMAEQGLEVIIGMSKDAQFGPILMFGLGGVLVEVLKDVSFRIVPLESHDASEMIRDIKGFPLLQGYRGSDPIDIANLEKMLLTVSTFVDNTPTVKELDLNPIFAYKDGAVAVDARVILEEVD
jgi:acyl-CoA synthetase (NDP forming)